MNLVKRFFYIITNAAFFLLALYVFRRISDSHAHLDHAYVLLGAWVYGTIMGYLWDIHDTVNGR